MFKSNVSTYDLEYSDEQRDLIIRNGYEVATLGNGTLDGEWSACVGCAVLSRSFWKTGMEVPDVCAKCFERYCWNGTRDSTTPAGDGYEPAFKLTEIKSGGNSLRVGSVMAAGVVMVIMGLL